MASPLHDRIQRLFGSFAIPGLIRYVVLFNALVFVLHLLAPGYASVLELNPALVLHGQIWRLFTWIFIPETFSPFWIFFSLLFLFYLGDGLERAMGPVKLTFFYASGVILCTAISFIFGLTGEGGVHLGRANTFLNLSLLLAYATVYPNFQVLVFFFLPMRISWLALVSALLMIFSSLGQPPVVAATLGVAFLNYILFFGGELRAHLAAARRASGLPLIRRIKPVRGISRINAPDSESLHRCESCDRTEITHPDLEFRVSSNGHEYCREHLPRAQKLDADPSL